MAEPRILVLDEPSLGLAPVLVTEIFHLVAGLRSEGRAILLSEQNARLSLAIADRGYVIENGRVTLVGTGNELPAQFGDRCALPRSRQGRERGRYLGTCGTADGKAPEGNFRPLIIGCLLSAARSHGRLRRVDHIRFVSPRRRAPAPRACPAEYAADAAQSGAFEAYVEKIPRSRTALQRCRQIIDNN